MTSVYADGVLWGTVLDYETGCRATAPRQLGRLIDDRQPAVAVACEIAHLPAPDA
jgi:hypothetical protein